MRCIASFLLLLASCTACAAVAAPTQPFHLIALPRSDDPVTFVAESPSR